MTPPKILVVEDESIVSLEIQSRIGDLGYLVSDAVFSGEQALLSVENNTPDLILMDINLRGEIDGIETANLISQKFSIPIIYMTAYADNETLQRAKATSPYAYIIKPIEVRELHTSIEIALFKSSIEKKLIESEKRFRSLFENATIGFYKTSFSGELLMANNAFIKILGIDEDDLKFNRNISYGYVDINRRKEFIELLNNEKIQPYLINNGNILGFESEWRKKDGSIIYISESARKYIDENGNIIFEGTVEDITKRKIAELDLKESEEVLSTIFNSGNNGIIIHDEYGKIIKVNERILDFHNITNEYALTLNISDLVKDSYNLEKLKSEWEKVLQGENKVIEIKTNSLKDDKLYDIEIYLSKLSIKENNYVLANLRNVTEQKRANSTLIRTKEVLRKVFDNVYNAIFIHDTNGDIIDVNDKVLSLYNVSKNEALSMNISQISSSDSPMYKVKDYWQKVVAGEDQLFEWKAMRPGDKFVFPVEVFLTKISIDNNDFILANVRDITEQKRNKEDLIFAKENAEKSNRLKTDFLASMSHEIRTPVNTILSYSSLLKDELLDMNFTQFDDIFRSISIGGQRLIRTVDSILNMSQIQTGTYEIINQELNLEEDVLRSVYSEFKIDAVNKGLKFGLINESKNPFVNVDYYSVGQLFTNLVDNAIKYTQSGKVSIKSYNLDNYLLVDVSDTGIGISEEFLKEIFDPFTQESQGYTRKFEGNGLGLALVKKYCSLNNAEIFVKSEKGCGSTFTVKFNNI